MGTVLATVRVLYRFSQTQIEEGRKQVVAATDVFSKMFALQRLNEQSAQSALMVKDLVRKSREGAEHQARDLGNAEAQLRSARLGIDETLRQVEDLQDLRGLAAKIKAAP